jgi:hypothetical protein
LDKLQLANSVVAALLSQPCGPLRPPQFRGVGVYAIYYHGQFPAYRSISNKECLTPIYVGSAIPKGGRKGGIGLAGQATNELSNRLRQHAASIEQSENLKLDNFTCRYLVVDEIWIPLAEQLLIAQAQPVWNRVVDGFGNHNPGKGRAGGARPLWDELHPGRLWAKTLPAASLTRKQIIQQIAAFFKTGDTPQEIDVGPEPGYV